MKTPRFNIPLVLVKDRYILALGGMTSKSKVVDVCEAYDTVNSTWYPLPHLDRARASTSAQVVNQRYVYIMPAPNSISWSTIEFLDLGYPFDIKSVKNKWQILSVASPEFTQSFGFGSTMISNT